MARLTLLTLCSIALAGAPSVASADLFLTIIVDDTGKPATTGGGTTAAVAATAAAYWEAAFAGSSVDYFLEITIGWGSVTDPGIAVGSSSLTLFPTAAGSTGTITLEFDGSVTFWLDPTPSDNSEFTAFASTSADLGGGSMVIGNVFSTPTASGPGSGEIDLLTVLLHEMGHVMHFGADFGVGDEPWVLAVGSDGILDVDTVGLPHFGAAIPLDALESHWLSSTLPDSVMESTIGAETRILLASTDILAIAEIHGFTTVDLTPTPEPSSFAMLALAGLALAARRRRRRAAA